MTTGRLLNIQISPFYAHIEATGLPMTVPLAGSLGSFTRTFLLLGFLALFAASLRPTSWWRNLAVYFGLSSLVELYLSFILMLYWMETAFVNALGVLPPLYGTTTLQANVIGLDLSYYTAPPVTATFSVTYYLGFLSLGLVLSRTFLRLLHERKFHILNSLLPGSGIRDVYLTPPYHQVWFSSGDEELNPLHRDPDNMSDDELIVSFEKFFEKVQPGGNLSIILPDWATSLADRLEKLMSQTGFALEKTGTIYRIPGNPENELRFRKPLPEISTIETSTLSSQPSPAVSLTEPEEILERPEEQIQASQEPPPTTVASEVEPAPPPMLGTGEKPVWMEVKMTRLERSIMKAAVRTISDRKQPVPYRELLNQVYMDLVDDKIEFDSARQIETTLLSHDGREVVLVEQSEDERGRLVKKWWLGDKKMPSDKSHGLPSLEQFKEVKPKLLKVKQVFKKPKKSRYIREIETSDEESLDASDG